VPDLNETGSNSNGDSGYGLECESPVRDKGVSEFCHVNTIIIFALFKVSAEMAMVQCSQLDAKTVLRYTRK
jgi:hypothetical protein